MDPAVVLRISCRCRRPHTTLAARTFISRCRPNHCTVTLLVDYHSLHRGIATLTVHFLRNPSKARAVIILGITIDAVRRDHIHPWQRPRCSVLGNVLHDCVFSTWPALARASILLPPLAHLCCVGSDRCFDFLLLFLFDFDILGSLMIDFVMWLEVLVVLYVPVALLRSERGVVVALVHIGVIGEGVRSGTVKRGWVLGGVPAVVLWRPVIATVIRGRCRHGELVARPVHLYRSVASFALILRGRWHHWHRAVNDTLLFEIWLRY